MTPSPGNDSILNSIKEALGIMVDFKEFDSILINHINSAIKISQQTGVGPSTPFNIEDENTTWSDFLEGRYDQQFAFSQILIRVRQVFDPPQTGFTTNALNEILKEADWRASLTECDT